MGRGRPSPDFSQMCATTEWFGRRYSTRTILSPTHSQLGWAGLFLKSRIEKLKKRDLKNAYFGIGFPNMAFVYILDPFRSRGLQLKFMVQVPFAGIGDETRFRQLSCSYVRFNRFIFLISVENCIASNTRQRK